MPRHSLTQWITHLRAIAAPVATGPPRGATAIEKPFSVVVCETVAGPRPEPVPPGEVGLWWALADDDVDVENLLGEPSPGPLWPRGDRQPIEVWTEADLCGLHALWCLARQRQRGDWTRRVEAVRDWHLDNTQPDNATNRPWALHVFLLASSPEAHYYAETLLHNSVVTTGRPDLLSAWILIDAAQQLEAEAARHPNTPA